MRQFGRLKAAFVHTCICNRYQYLMCMANCRGIFPCHDTYLLQLGSSCDKRRDVRALFISHSHKAVGGGRIKIDS